MNIVKGSVQGMDLDGNVTFFWWGSEDTNDGPDTVATFSGQVRLYESATACAAAAKEAGWPADPTVDTSIIDALPVQQWLRRERLALNPASALNVLNLALDFAHATHTSWDPRRGKMERCYRKLFAANVPYFFGLSSFEPQWSRYELNVLRVSLDRAIALLRAASLVN